MISFVPNAVNASIERFPPVCGCALRRCRARTSSQPTVAGLAPAGRWAEPGRARSATRAAGSLGMEDEDDAEEVGAAPAQQLGAALGPLPAPAAQLAHPPPVVDHLLAIGAEDGLLAPGGGGRLQGDLHLPPVDPVDDIAGGKGQLAAVAPEDVQGAGEVKSHLHAGADGRPQEPTGRDQLGPASGGGPRRGAPPPPHPTRAWPAPPASRRRPAAAPAATRRDPGARLREPTALTAGTQRTTLSGGVSPAIR